MTGHLVASLSWAEEQQLRAAVDNGLVLAADGGQRLIESLLANLDDLRAAVRELDEAQMAWTSGQSLAAKGVISPTWQDAVAWEDRVLTALREVRTLVDGRPRT